jgi:hypothetical protein
MGDQDPPRAPPKSEGGSGSPLGHPPYSGVCSGDMKSPAQTDVSAGAIHRAEGGVCMVDFMSTMRGAGSARPCKNKGVTRAAAPRGALFAAAGLEPATFGL